MILASTFSSLAEAESFFHVLEAEGEQSLELAKRYWGSLENTSKLQEAMREAEMEWRLLLNHLPPAFVALSGYRSGSFSRKGITIPDDSALLVMDKLKAAWGVKPADHVSIVPRDVKDPDRWLVHRCRDTRVADGRGKNLCRTVVDMADVVHLFW